MADPRTAVLSVLLLVGFAIAGWLFAPVFRGREAARRHLGTHRLALAGVVVVVLFNALLTLPLAPLLRATQGAMTTGTFLVAALATQIPMLLLIYFRLIAPGAVTWQELGLRPLPIDRIVRVGVLTALGGIGLTVLLDAALSQVGLRQNQLEQFRFVRGGGLGPFLLVFVIGVVVAPCVEELFFRGFLFGLYRRRQPLWAAYLATGAVFALLHLEPTSMGPSQMAALAVGIFALGTLLAWTYQRTDSLFPGMVAHAVNNAVGLIAFYAVGGT